MAKVFVGDQGIINVTPMSSTLLYLFANDTGETELQILTDDGNVMAASTIVVGLDETALKTEFAAEAPLADVDIRAKGDTVEALGRVNSIDQALDVDRFLQRQEDRGLDIENRTVLATSNQINLRVRIGEIDRTEITRLGINWRGILDSSSVQFGLGVGEPIADGVETGAAALGLDLGDFTLDSVIEALKRENAIEILAEPNLTVLNGKRARFLAGGEIPIPVSGGIFSETNVIFKAFGVSLEFMPTLLSGNRIQLAVTPEVSSILQSDDALRFSIDGTALPTFSIRRADTTIEMASGQTLAIAGLFEQKEIDTISKLPLFGDLPILGPLFRSKRYERRETELIILITPYLVEPAQTPLGVETFPNADGS